MEKVKPFAEIEAENPVLEEADAIIVAAGAIPMMPPIKGIENTINVLEAHLDENKLKGDKIIYCGGGLSSCDSALETALKGRKVAIIEMLDEVAAGDHMINKASLIPMLLENKVELYTGHKVLEITAEGVKAMQRAGKLGIKKKQGRIPHKRISALFLSQGVVIIL